MNSKFRNSILAILASFSICGTSISLHAQDFNSIAEVDLKTWLVPFRFDQNAPTAMERRLDEITQQIVSACQVNPSERVCLWPKLVVELKTVARILVRDSFDGENLNLTLAARLHPISFVSYYKTGLGFESTYARYLIAQRLMREFWPLVLEANTRLPLGLTASDDWIVPWLGARTPWSFFLNLSRGYSCVGGSGCGTKAEILFTLQEVVTAFKQDPLYVANLEAFKLETAPQFPEAGVDAMYASLLRVISDDSAGVLLMFPVSASYSSLDWMSAKRYLDSIATEAGKPVVGVAKFSGSACAQLDEVLSLARKESQMSWPGEITGTFACSEKNGMISTISGEAFEKIKGGHGLWLFNFYHLQLMIAKIFKAMKETDATALKLRQAHEIFRDTESVREAVEKTEPISHSDADYERLKLTMSYLYKYVLETQETVEDLLRKDEP